MFVTRLIPKEQYQDLNKYLKANPGDKWKTYKEDVAVEFLYAVYRGTFFKDYGDSNSDYKVNLYSRVLRSIHIDYARYMDLLVKADLINRSTSYSVGRFPKLYGINTKYINSAPRYYKITRKALVNSINRTYALNSLSPAQEDRLTHLKRSISINEAASVKMLRRVAKKENWLSVRLNNAIYGVKRIGNCSFYLKQDRFGREHTNFSNLPKIIRNKYVKIDGESLYENDIPNSQPTFLLRTMLEEGVSFDNNYLSAIQNSSIYEDFMTYFKDDYGLVLTRDEAKKVVFKVFYDKERNKPFREDTISNWHYQRCFKDHYPLVYKYIQWHHTKYGYKALAHKLQQVESTYVFGKVDALDIPYFTIHDSVFVASSNKEKVAHLFDDVIN